ncbi:MAG: GNAT family N-acetyltransferase [Candidatus Promineifilaceae bacterium]
MDLAQKRRAIRYLIDRRRPADALASYYAFYHPDEKTNLTIYPADGNKATGYMALSRTGFDIFRPLVTMRLPIDNHTATADLISAALPPGAPVIIYAPPDHEALIKAFFEVQVEDALRVLVLDRGRYEPVINILVTQDVSSNGYPRFIIRARNGQERVVASAAINWQTPDFTDISVFTEMDQRRQGWGKSVVAALCQHILDSGRTPLYAVSEANQPSLRLAESVGFADLGIRRKLFEAVTRERLN